MLGEPDKKLTDEEAETKRKNGEIATKWLKAISQRRTKEKTWREKSRKVIDRYIDDRDEIENIQTRFNILWANTEVLKPAIFARMPVADVRRRYLTRDPVARTAAMILERSLSYCMDSYDFKDTLDRAEEDYLLPGRGQVVVCYKPYFKQNRTEVGPPLPPDTDYPKDTLFDDEKARTGAHTMAEEKLYEEVYCEYQSWDLYVFGEAKQRAKVPWEAYGDRLTKEEVREEYPDFKDIDALNFVQDKEEYAEEVDKDPPKCVIWRVWDKTHRKLIVLAEGYKGGPLEEPTDDPLGLENFFPTPEPLYSLRVNGNCVPKPEFCMYQDQANELDILVNRQRTLTQALKYRGVYDKMLDTDEGKFSEIARAGDNVFLPVPNFSSLAEKGGIESLIDNLPLEEIAKVLAWLAQRIDILKQEIYEVYGISDIVRGSTKASETLGAQQLKAQYAGMRISTRQERFQRFIRDILRIKAEIIAEHFSPETLKIMTGIDVLPDQLVAQQKQAGELKPNTVSESEFMQACQLIKSDKLRGFRIDIETDSTVPVDKDTEQQNRVQFMQAVGQYLQGIIPAVQMGAIPIKMAREGLLFVVRGFKVGTELEETLEELGEGADEAQQMKQMQETQQQMQEQLQQIQEENQKLKEQNQQLQAKSEVEMVKAQSKAQLESQSATQKAQTDQMAAQHDAQLKETEASHSAQLQEREAAHNASLEMAKSQSQAALDEREAAHAAALDERKAEHEAQIREREATLDARLKIMEAQIQAHVAAKTADNDNDSDEGKSGKKPKKDTNAPSIEAIARGIEALATHATMPRHRAGKMKLPSGGTATFEVSE